MNISRDTIAAIVQQACGFAEVSTCVRRSLSDFSLQRRDFRLGRKLRKKKKKGRDALTRRASRHSSSPSGVRLPAPLVVLPRATHPPSHIVVRTPCSPPFSLSFGASSRRARPRTRHLPPSASTRVHCESISRNRCLTPPLPPPPPPTGCKHTHTRISASGSSCESFMPRLFFLFYRKKKNAFKLFIFFLLPLSLSLFVLFFLL